MIIKVLRFQGKEPFTGWMNSLKDIVARAKILRRVDRLEQDNYGEHRYLKKGIFELKINYGPGYRVYCGEKNKDNVILLYGGDKSTQSKDLEKVYKYWEDYNRENV